MTTEDLATRIKELTREHEKKKELILTPVEWRFVGAPIVKERHLYTRLRKLPYPCFFDGQVSFAEAPQFYKGVVTEGLVCNLPFYAPDLSGDSFTSRDPYEQSVTVFLAEWTSAGRVF